MAGRRGTQARTGSDSRRGALHPGLALSPASREAPARSPAGSPVRRSVWSVTASACGSLRSGTLRAAKCSPRILSATSEILQEEVCTQDAERVWGREPRGSQMPSPRSQPWQLAEGSADPGLGPRPSLCPLPLACPPLLPRSVPGPPPRPPVVPTPVLKLEEAGLGGQALTQLPGLGCVRGALRPRPPLSAQRWCQATSARPCTRPHRVRLPALPSAGPAPINEVSSLMARWPCPTGELQKVLGGPLRAAAPPGRGAGLLGEGLLTLSPAQLGAGTSHTLSERADEHDRGHKVWKLSSDRHENAPWLTVRVPGRRIKGQPPH